MPLRDYSEEDDYYTQDFEKDGVVSIWVGLKDHSDAPPRLDVLQDLCGVGYYDLDSQEANCFAFELVKLSELLGEMSYSESFLTAALAAAEKRGLSEARSVVLQYDFDYDQQQVTRPVADDPVFIGSFDYVVE